MKHGGFFQFSILHPCFTSRYTTWDKDTTGRHLALRIRDYLDPEPEWIEEFTFGAAPEEVREGLEPFRVPRFDRTLAQWLNVVADAGFVLERVREPKPSKAAVRENPRLEDALRIPWFLQARWRKPS